MSYVEVCKVSKRIGPEEVLSNVNFEVDLGSIVGLEGENGSGKTMAMRTVCGLVRPDTGTVSVDGKQLWRQIDFPQSLGFLIEEPALLNSYSGLKNLELLASIRNTVTKEELKQAMNRVGLLPDNKKPCKTYSLGMKQRLGIALAIMEHPELLVLDEPTNALDEEGRAMLVNVLQEEKKRGAAILISSHDQNFLSSICDMSYHMSFGKICKAQTNNVKGETR
nr:ABC transporter ATP-binding protein [uncultured Olegusella sp.]